MRISKYVILAVSYFLFSAKGYKEWSYTEMVFDSNSFYTAVFLLFMN